MTNLRDHWTKIFSNDDYDNNDFDYDHVTQIENNLNDYFAHIRTYDYGALYRLDRDFPPITTIEFNNTLRILQSERTRPNQNHNPTNKKYPIQHYSISTIRIQPLHICRPYSGCTQTRRNDIYTQGQQVPILHTKL